MAWQWLYADIRGKFWRLLTVLKEQSSLEKYLGLSTNSIAIFKRIVRTFWSKFSCQRSRWFHGHSVCVVIDYADSLSTLLFSRCRHSQRLFRNHVGGSFITRPPCPCSQRKCWHVHIVNGYADTTMITRTISAANFEGFSLTWAFLHTQ